MKDRISEFANFLREMFIDNLSRPKSIEDCMKFDEFRPIIHLLLSYLPTPNRNALSNDLNVKIFSCNSMEDADKLAADINNDCILMKNEAFEKGRLELYKSLFDKVLENVSVKMTEDLKDWRKSINP